jgi:single-strand DNA-binding protein
MINNYVQLLGRIGQDIDLITTENSFIANFSIATNESYIKNNEKIEKTEWHKIVSLGKTAQNINKYAKKGDLILVHGKLQTRSWENKEGQKRYVTEVLVNEFKLLCSNKNEDLKQTIRPKDDDIPF